MTKFKSDAQRRAVMSRLSKSNNVIKRVNRLTVDNIAPKDWVKTYDSKKTTQWERIGGTKKDMFILKPTFTVYDVQADTMIPFETEQDALAFVQKYMNRKI